MLIIRFVWAKVQCHSFLVSFLHDIPDMVTDTLQRTENIHKDTGSLSLIHI